MNFFFDANMNRRYARMLSSLHEGEHDIIHITEHQAFIRNNVFSPGGTLIGNNTKDVEWIGTLGRSGIEWKIISGEADIIDTAQERAALIESRLTFFSMDHNWNRLRAADQAWKLARIWEQLVEAARTAEPTLYRVHMGNRQRIEVIRGGMRARGGRFRG